MTFINDKCGHPASMTFRLLESGGFMCMVCDLQGRVRDAENREKELFAENTRFREQLAATEAKLEQSSYKAGLETLREHAGEFTADETRARIDKLLGKAGDNGPVP